MYVTSVSRRGAKIEIREMCRWKTIVILCRLLSASADPQKQPVVQLDCVCVCARARAEQPLRLAPPKESLCDPGVMDIDATKPGSMCAQAVYGGLNLPPADEHGIMNIFVSDSCFLSVVVRLLRCCRL